MLSVGREMETASVFVLSDHDLDSDAVETYREDLCVGHLVHVTFYLHCVLGYCRCGFDWAAQHSLKMRQQSTNAQVVET